MKILFLLAFFTTSFAQAEFQVPPLGNKHVIDKAGVLSRKTERTVHRALSQAKRDSEVEMVVLTVPSLDGTPIEEASIRISEQWKLGKASSDKGLLLLLSIGDRKLRLEVGQGLEGDVPDAYAKRIVSDAMTPLLRTGDIDSAVVLGTYATLKRALPNKNIDTYFEGAQIKKSGNKKLTWFHILIYIIVFLIMISSRGGLLGFLLGSAMGSRRGYYGGGFGGGLGGGGGFSGGGASGSW